MCKHCQLTDLLVGCGNPLKKIGTGNPAQQHAKKGFKQTQQINTNTANMSKNIYECNTAIKWEHQRQHREIQNAGTTASSARLLPTGAYCNPELLTPQSHRAGSSTSQGTPARKHRQVRHSGSSNGQKHEGYRRIGNIGC